MANLLVTGGAGLIGSHATDLLVRKGWQVRVLDNLEPNTHRRGKPAWINPKAEFVEGDLRDRKTMARSHRFGIDFDRLLVVRRRSGKVAALEEHVS